MNDDSRDPIIDSLLEEVFGGEQPPDLTARILREHNKTTRANEVDLPDDEVVIVADNKRRDSSSQIPKRRYDYNGWAAAAVVLIGAGLFTVWAIDQQAKVNANDPKTVAKKSVEEIVEQQQAQRTKSTDPIQQPINIPVSTPPKKVPTSNEPQPKVEPTEVNPSIPQQPLMAAEFQRKRIPSGKPWGDARIVKFINSELKDGWDRAGVNPFDPINDLGWFVRATETLLGRKPNDEELKEFDDKRDREAALDRLLANNGFAENWANYFAGVLVGRSEKADRGELEKFLAEAILEEKPFDQLAFELLTAQGSNQKSDQEFNPASNFLLAHARPTRPRQQSEAMAALTDRVCQVFLGQQLQCARCHDNQRADVAQRRYWELASFFAQLQVRPNDQGQYRLINSDYSGSKGDSPKEADVFYTMSDNVGVSVFPVNVQGQALDTNSGLLADIDRRTELANSIVSSDQFAQATVNRLWKFVFQNGFTQRVDDMGTHSPVSHPRLLARMSTEFQNSQFSLQSTLRWMLMSRAFDRRLSPTNRLPVAFNSFARRDLASFPSIGQAVAQLARARQKGERFDASIYASVKNDAGTLTRKQKETEFQRVASRYRSGLLNTTNPDSILVQLGGSKTLNDERRVEHLFYAFVGRSPTPKERNNSLTVLRNTRSKIIALQRIGWLIINSEEFKTQH